MDDRGRLYTCAFLRALATAMVGVLLGVYLAKLRLPAAQIGWVVTAGLAGAASASLLAMLRADRMGRRRFLSGLAVLGAAGGAACAVLSQPMALALAAFAGMVNGMGRDRGAALVLEQAVLPATTDDAHRTRTFAWYNVVQDAGHALGSLGAGLPLLLQRAAGLSELAGFRASVAVYALLLLLPVPLYARLSTAVEPTAPARRGGSQDLLEHANAGGGGEDGGGDDSVEDNPAQDRRTGARREPLAPASRRILVRISALFALDSLGGGFLTAALLSYYFYQRFGVSEARIGVLFFGARVLNALSHLGAAWLARRIGLVNTMVFTHIPSSILLLTVAIAPSFPVAAGLFLLREGLVEMDVPTRQSYVMAVVRPQERVLASGVTHLVRMGAWAVAPAFAGSLMQGLSLGAPLMLGAGMKVTYDVLLYAAFRRVKPPEEART